MNPTQQNNFLDSLRKNWFLIVFLGGIIMGWTTLKNRVDNVQAAQSDQKADIKDLTAQTSALNNAIVEIKANYIFIKASLDQLNKK